MNSVRHTRANLAAIAGSTFTDACSWKMNRKTAKMGLSAYHVSIRGFSLHIVYDYELKQGKEYLVFFSFAPGKPRCFPRNVTAARMDNALSELVPVLDFRGSGYGGLRDPAAVLGVQDAAAGLHGYPGDLQGGDDGHRDRHGRGAFLPG